MGRPERLGVVHRPHLSLCSLHFFWPMRSPWEEEQASLSAALWRSWWRRAVVRAQGRFLCQRKPHSPQSALCLDTLTLLEDKFFVFLKKKTNRSSFQAQKGPESPGVLVEN